MKTLILIFMKLYCKRMGNVAVADHRNYLHGFIGSLIFAFGLLVIAEYKEYENWALLGILAGLILAFLSGLVWEIIQDFDNDKKFQWQDVFASNIWFIPLWFIANFVRQVAPETWRAAENEFVK